MGKDINTLTGSDLETYTGGITETFTIGNFNNNKDVREHIKNYSKQMQHLESLDQLKMIPTHDDGSLEKEHDPIAAEIAREIWLDMYKVLQNPSGEKNKNTVFGFTYKPAIKTDPDSELKGAWTITTIDDYLENFTSNAIKTVDGKLNPQQVQKYKEITMVFPTSLDLNPAKAGNYNVAATDARISMSDDNTYYYNDVAKTAGSFRIYKENGRYYRIADFVGVNPKTGELYNFGQEPNKVYLSDKNGQPVTSLNIDNVVADLKNKMITISENNIKNSNIIKEKNKSNN
jgi:hypothetical protein